MLLAAFATLLLAAAGEGESAKEEEKEEVYTPPTTVDGAHFFESFVEPFGQFVQSQDAGFSGSWRHETYAEPQGHIGDMGLVVGNAAKKHAVSTVFAKPFDLEKGLVIQYELQTKKALQCGGAYLKLLTSTEALTNTGFHADTPYTIMFGPDKCGETNKVHFIVRHQHPKTLEWEEKHLTSPPLPDVGEGATHLYTAIVNTDSSVQILVDNKEVKSASLLSETDFKPPLLPPKRVDDPADAKPADWVDDAKIDDPAAAKPADWDEDAPIRIPDPKAVKPAGWLDDAPLKIGDPTATAPGDWDVDEDGDWEAPLIDNPACKDAGCGEWTATTIANPEYKGKWIPPKVDNPAYIGVWAPRQVDNPNFFVDETPYKLAPIGGIGVELWTMQDGMLFDNILLTSDAASAASLGASSFEARIAKEAAKKKAKAKREIKRGDGFLGAVKYFVLVAFAFVEENAVVVGATLCIGILPLLLFCCGGKKKPKPAGKEKAPAKKEAAASSSSDAAEEKTAAPESDKDK